MNVNVLNLILAVRDNYKLEFHITKRQFVDHGIQKRFTPSITYVLQ